MPNTAEPRNIYIYSSNIFCSFSWALRNRPMETTTTEEKKETAMYMPWVCVRPESDKTAEEAIRYDDDTIHLIFPGGSAK